MASAPGNGTVSATHPHTITVCGRVYRTTMQYPVSHASPNQVAPATGSQQQHQKMTEPSAQKGRHAAAKSQTEAQATDKTRQPVSAAAAEGKGKAAKTVTKTATRTATRAPKGTSSQESKGVSKGSGSKGSGSTASAQPTAPAVTTTDATSAHASPATVEGSLERNDDGTWVLEIELPERLLVHRNAGHFDQLGKKTGTSVQLPSNVRGSGRGVAPVVITGAGEEALTAAQSQLARLVPMLIRDSRLTHFVCLPLASDATVRALETFQQELLQVVEGVNCTIFMPPKGFHVTVTCLKLLTQRDVDRAVEVISTAVQDYAALLNGDKQVLLRGLGSFGVDKGKRKTKVVFMEPSLDPSLGGDLQGFVDGIKDAVCRSGLPSIGKLNEAVRLHATVMNSKYMKVDGRKPRRQPLFDATTLLQQYDHHDLGVSPIDEIQLCEMARNPDGSYVVEARIPLP
eukprot:m.136413 g.136413  ORF g.136413 m.136413 type:complete len:457 (+) comp13996_c0_seq1:166-1536(+)